MLDLSRVSSLGELLWDTTLAHQSNEALIEAERRRENSRLTYRELRAVSARVGALLQQEGVVAGDRVAILMSNQSRWLASATGAFWAGAVLVPLDYKLTPGEQAALLRHARPAALVVEYPIWRRLAPSGSELPALRVLVTEAPPEADLFGAQRWETATDHVLERPMRRRDDVACIVYSSGTGGTPKGCQLTHGNYLAQAQILGELFPVAEGDRYFSFLPTNHAIDFMCGFILPLAFGSAVVHQRSLRPEFLSWTMKRYRITHMALVPLVLRALEQRIRNKIDALPSWQRSALRALVSVNELATERGPKHWLSRRLLQPLHAEFGGRLRLMFVGGAPVDADTASFFYRLGLPVVIGYGLTEACTVVTVNDLQPFRAETVGRPVPGLEVTLRPQGGTGRVRTGQVGEVWLRGPTVMKGYFDAPELTAQALVDGWLDTGDLGWFDASGHLRLVGRTKNMIVTAGGKNVYPEDIEAAFDGVNGCEEHCVFAADYVWPSAELQGGELMLVLRPDAAEGDALDRVVDEVRARNRRLADAKRIRGYVVWERAFPRTASLKVKRTLLAAEVREAAARDRALVRL